MERKLKFATWKLDRENKEITLTTFKYDVTGIPLETGSIILNKTYLFSLMRFLVSAAQKLTVTPRVKKITS